MMSSVKHLGKLCLVFLYNFRVSELHLYKTLAYSLKDETRLKAA